MARKKTLTVETALVLTADEIEDMTAAELVAAYNILALPGRLKPVTRFESHAVGTKRVSSAIQRVKIVQLDLEMAAATKEVKLAAATPAVQPNRMNHYQQLGLPQLAPYIRGLIKEGKSNKAIWEIIKPLYQLDDKRRNYPCWYRAELARRKKGIIRSRYDDYVQ